MNILVSTPTFLPVIGGAELGVHEIYNRIGQRHDVTVITPWPGGSAIAAYGSDNYQGGRYDVQYIWPAPERIRPGILGKALRRSSLPYILTIHRLHARGPFDVANFHFLAPHGAALMYARRRLRIPIAISLVGRSDVVHQLGSMNRARARGIISATDAVLPISSYYHQGLHSNGAGTVTIPYGVDTTRFSPQMRSARLRQELGIDPDAVVLLAVQRLAPIKRVDMLIRALGELLRREPKAVLIIVGQGEERASLERLTEHLGLAKQIRFAGYVERSDLPRYFASADVFAFHSMAETFGIVFAEAMASGLPIVAASTSCVPHVVLPENGILVPPNDLAAFSVAVLQLVRDRALREQMARRNRERAVREFDWNVIAAAYEDVLLRISRRAR